MQKGHHFCSIDCQLPASASLRQTLSDSSHRQSRPSGQGDRASGCRRDTCWTAARARTAGGGRSRPRHCWPAVSLPRLLESGVPVRPSAGSHPELGKAELTPSAQTEAVATVQKQDPRPHPQPAWAQGRQGKDLPRCSGSKTSLGLPCAGPADGPQGSRAPPGPAGGALAARVLMGMLSLCPDPSGSCHS